MIELFDKIVKEHPLKETLFIERGGKWVSWTWQQFYNESINFAKAVISMKIPPFKTVNILASNCPEWLISFMGGIYACVVPVGVYITNNSETCTYIAEHSECGILVVDSVAQYKKYENDLAKLPDLKVVVFFCEVKNEEIALLQTNAKNVKLIKWKDFIKLGETQKNDELLNERISMQRPGNCCDIVYTSGTTGPPKAVMLSHDNFTWTGLTFYHAFKEIVGTDNRSVSFLPLSHIASQYTDIIRPMIDNNQVYFARADALTSGSLLDTIKFVKPTGFFAVPRIYEKFEDRIRETFEKASTIKKKISKYII